MPNMVKGCQRHPWVFQDCFVLTHSGWRRDGCPRCVVSFLRDIGSSTLVPANAVECWSQLLGALGGPETKGVGSQTPEVERGGMLEQCLG